MQGTIESRWMERKVGMWIVFAESSDLMKVIVWVSLAFL